MKGFFMKLYLFNTLTKQKEEVKPLKPPHIYLYTCGPTVYNYAHIGNFRTYVFEDLLRRTLKYFGFKVDQVMNITDVEDKTIQGALQEGISLSQYTARYKKAFFEDIDLLKIEKVEHYPDATAYIPQMIALIERLLAKRVAYQDEEGNVFFSIDKFPSYGKLSHLKLTQLQAKASKRVDSDEYDKENVSDFTLWKAYDPKRDGPIFWESPFGRGRPGWHIECSAMAMAILGESIDIHVGGVDNLFPHHENEIAQCEACTGKPFVRYWLHAEHLLVDHKKMAKSLGNFYTLRDLLQMGYSGLEVRYALLSVHYRLQLNFTFSSLDAARASTQRLGDLIDRLRLPLTGDIGLVTAQELINQAQSDFTKALADDLNISSALAVVFDMVREVNTLLDRGSLGKKAAEQILSWIEKMDQVLGIFPMKQEHKVSLEKDLEEALFKREKARSEKNWKEADYWRDFLLSKGYLIEDTPSGPRLKKK